MATAAADIFEMEEGGERELLLASILNAICCFFFLLVECMTDLLFINSKVSILLGHTGSYIL